MAVKVMDFLYCVFWANTEIYHLKIWQKPKLRNNSIFPNKNWHLCYLLVHRFGWELRTNRSSKF